MDLIRRLVYKFGFRPKPGTLLYSPSLALTLAVAEGLKAMVEVLDGMKGRGFYDE